MTDPSDRITEDEALRLWQRAAQLQADAARLAEEARAAETSAEDTSAGNDDEASESPDGYALVHVRAAALEAGIGEEFVERALAEVRAQRLTQDLRHSRTARLAARVLGDPPSEIVRSRVMRATPERVLEAMEAVLPFEPFTMALRERRGNPAQGGVMVFDLQGVGFVQGAEAGGFRKDASYADLRQVYVTLTARRIGDATETEVTLRAPIAWAWSLNAGIGAVFVGLGGGLGALAGLAVGAAVATLGPVGAGLGLALGAGGGGSGGLALLRALYGFGARRGGVALDGALSAVALKAEGGWGIGRSTVDGGSTST
jgi:hypothetical protein